MTSTFNVIFLFQDRLHYNFVFHILFQLKGVIVGEDLQMLHETQVQFDTTLPEFRLVKYIIL